MTYDTNSNYIFYANNIYLPEGMCTEYDIKVKHGPVTSYQYIHGMQTFRIVHFEMKFIKLQILNEMSRVYII